MVRSRSTRVQARSGVRVMAAQSGYQWLNKEPIAVSTGLVSCGCLWASFWALVPAPARLLLLACLLLPACRPPPACGRLLADAP